MLLRRSRADSNRCGSFCRALPSHSATGPFYVGDFVVIKLQACLMRYPFVNSAAKIKQSKEF